MARRRKSTCGQRSMSCTMRSRRSAQSGRSYQVSAIRRPVFLFTRMAVFLPFGSLVKARVSTISADDTVCAIAQS
jgi:hypothetical protein